MVITDCGVDVFTNYVFKLNVLEVTVSWYVIFLSDLVKGHEQAVTEKVSQAGYSSLFPDWEDEWFVIDLEHRVVPERCMETW